MIQRKEAQMQVLRLSSLPGADQFVDGSGELVETELTDALQQFSNNREHASRIISAWLARKPRYLPTADHIRALAIECDQEYDERLWRCSHCHDTGFAKTYQLLTWESPTKKQIQTITQEQYQQLERVVSGVLGEQCVVEAVERCMHCSLGRRRAEEAERDRVEEAVKKAPVGAGR